MSVDKQGQLISRHLYLFVAELCYLEDIELKKVNDFEISLLIYHSNEYVILIKEINQTV